MNFEKSIIMKSIAQDYYYLMKYENNFLNE